MVKKTIRNKKKLENKEERLLMKKMINKSHVEGLLYENELKLQVAGASAKNPGMEYVAGKLHIETSENNIVPVDFYEGALTSKGNRNGKFDTIKDLVTAASVMGSSRELALGIKVDSAVSLNQWYKGEELIATPRNFGGFLHAMAQGNLACGATFEVDAVIVNTAAETKKLPDQTIEETGRLVVNGLIFDFRNDIMPVKFIVENPNGIKFFEAIAPNTFTKVWGNQVSATFKVVKTEESAFGDSKVNESEYSRKEFVITGVMKDAYLNDADLTVQDIQTAMANRNVALATMKQKNEARNANKGSAPSGQVNPLDKLNAGNTSFTF